MVDHGGINGKGRDELQELEMLHFERGLLLFRFLPFVHHFAQLAGVLPAEGFLQGDEERVGFRIAQRHSNPGDRLDEGPVPAYRNDKRYDDETL